MPWIKLTDDWSEDPRIVEAGDDGGWLWVLAVSWSARNLTDGHIPARQLLRLSTLPDVVAVAERLVSIELFEASPKGGWQVANYHRYQPTRSDVMAQREQAADRQRRRRTGSVTRDIGVTSGERGEVVTREFSTPTPIPTPTPKSSSSPELSTAVSAVLDAIADQRTTAAKTAGRIKTSAKGFRDRTRANLPSEDGLVEKAERVVDTYDAPTAVLAELVEGSRDGRYVKRRNGSDVAAGVVAGSEAVGA